MVYMSFWLSKIRTLSTPRRTLDSKWILRVFLMVFYCFPSSIEGQNNQAADLKKRIENARSFERLRDYNEATIILEKVLSDSPHNPSAVNSLIRLYFQLEAFEKAIALLENQLKKTPKNINFHRSLADVFYRTNRPEEAEEQIRILLDLYPTNEMVVRQVGALYTNKKLFGKAVAAYLSGRQRLGKPDAFNLQLAGLYTAMRDIPNSVREYVRWLTLYPDQFDLVSDRIDQLTGFSSRDLMEQALQGALSEQPGSRDAHNLLGNFYLRHDKPEEALSEYREADRLDGSTGMSLIKFAEWALREGYQKEAQNVYLELIQDFASQTVRSAAFLGLAKTYRQMGSFNESAAIYREFIATFPPTKYRKEARFHLAGLYLSHDHNARKALDSYISLLSDGPGTAFRKETMFGIAKCYVVLNKMEEAIAQYNRILNPKTGFKETKIRARADFHLGEIALFQGRLDDALDRFHRLADRDTSSPYANDALEWIMLLMEGRPSGDDSLRQYIQSVLHQQQYQDQKALDACKRHIEKYPESLIVDTVILAIGKILNRIGKPYQAVAALRDLTQRFPDSRRHVTAQWQIAEIYETEIGDIAKALTEYETILISHPEHFNNDTVRRKISALTKNHPPKR